VALVCAFFLVQPSWFGPDFLTQTTTTVNPNAIINPLGDMTFKYIALLTFLVIGLILLIVDTRMLKDDREGEWGHLTPSSRVAGFLAGLLAMWIILTMGFYRESAREPWAILDIFPVEGLSMNPTPVGVGDILITWIGITVFMFILLYAVSRRSSYNPETAE
jgi:cytochrome bd-type quinol oxidase subunit 1